MTLRFGRAICGDLPAAESREWLVTNGIGGYAAGTVAGLLTRRYHGILVAALQPPLGRTVLVAKVDEILAYDGAEYPLSTHRWRGGTVDPHGYRNLESFSLEGTIPVWRFAGADALLEKRIWMAPGANTSYVRYQLIRAGGPVRLSIKALVNYRDYHGNTHGAGWRMRIEPVEHGLRIDAYAGAVPFYLLSDQAQATPAHEWYYGFELAVEQQRGLDPHEDILHAGDFAALLEPGQSLTLVASTQADAGLDGGTALDSRRRDECQMLAQANLEAATPGWVKQLVLAADQFIVDRPLADGAPGKTVIAGYPWFSDWGRDTMISLPGLTLVTNRAEVARAVLRTFARYVDRGMLPNRFPDAGATPEYNTVDATLWYFEALRAYHAATGDDGLVQELFPVLAAIIAWHQRGTRFGIQVDPGDGLLYAGEPGTQLTWMDVKIGDWVVTPRTGKPVDINALWYNALCSMARFAGLAGHSPREYLQAADRALQGFGRFWNAPAGYCYDVLDSPEGNDASLRPNQIFAVSLPASPLTAVQQRAVVDSCARYLLTSHGLRSLAPADPRYRGHYGGDSYQRDSGYHQGTVWGWLLGPFSLAHLRVYRDPAQALALLEPMADHLSAAGLGTLSEIFDGNPPLSPRGCIAQAWSVAEVLRAWQAISRPLPSP